jgi:hypothetical protein
MAKTLSLGRMKVIVYLMPYHRAHLHANCARQVKLPSFYGKSKDHLLVRILIQLNPTHWPLLTVL